MISIREVTKRYGSLTAVDRLSLEFADGKIIGLLGPNGCGKTTLIKIIAGLIKDYQGEIRVDGINPGIETRSTISYCPDRFAIPKGFKIKDAIEYFEKFFPNFNKTKCFELLDKFKLDPNFTASVLSKGNKEKLMIILTLCREAKVYIFDEPGAAVDAPTRAVIYELIQTANSNGATVLITTHLIGDLESILDDIIFMNNGKVLLHRDKHDLVEKNQKSVDALFREVFRC